MLERCFAVLQKEHPDLVKSREKKAVFHLPDIKYGKEGKNTFITNFEEICNSLHRPIDHVQQFILTELGCKGNLNSENCLIFRDRYELAQIQKAIRKYSMEYIVCNSCASVNTLFQKTDKLLEIICQECHSSRTTQSIKNQTVITKVRKNQ